MRPMIKRFAGFPAGRLGVTQLPNLVFSELLPAIDSLVELKVTLHVFWLLAQKKGYPRFVTLRELEADEALARALKMAERPRDSVPGEAASPLAEGLALADARGTLLHLHADVRGQVQELYFANTENGRRAVEQLRAGELDIGQTLVALPEVPAMSAAARAERPGVFDLYEQNIGLVTPLIAEELTEAERLYPEDWVRAAFQQAVVYNRRNWRYIVRILERWAVEGRREGDRQGGRRAAPGRDRGPGPGGQTR